MRQLRVELSRYFSRRAIVLLLVAAGLLTVLVTGTTVSDTRPVSAREQAAARAQVQEQLDSPQFERDLASCEQNPEQFFGPGAGKGDCEAQLTPTPQQFLSREPLSLDRQRESGGLALVVILAALMIIAGTTFAGGDWATGSMSNQLIFQPRRLRVWTAKAVGVTLASATVSAVLLAVFWVTLLLVAQSRGIQTPVSVQREVVWMVARGVTLAALVGLGGYALTMLLRSTVGTLALLFAYAAGGEALLALSPVPRSGMWSLTNNVFAWIRDGVRVFDGTVVCSTREPLCDQTYTVSLAHGSVYLGTLLVATLVVSTLAFRRRDVP